jgi:CRISPR-associated protein Cas1
VEYKRGKPKKDNCDRVQLCAQALCLEEMLDVEIPCGALFYGKTRRRKDVDFDNALKKHLNTLFVTTQGSYLAKEGETVVVKVERKIRLRIPIHTIGGIVCFGNITCSPFLMGFCAERDVAISFLTEYGRFLARVQGPVSGNVLLRREQYRRADDMNVSAEMARAVLTGKLANCRTVLRRALRDHSDKLNADKVHEASQRIRSSLVRLQLDLPLNVLRGIEGEAAHTYFGVFDHLITSQKQDFFSGDGIAGRHWTM